MTKQLIAASGAGASTGAITDRFVFAAATAVDETTQRRVPEADDFEEEVRIVLERIETTLGQAGLTLRDITKVSVWVSEEQYRLRFARAYQKLMAPGPYPARTMFMLGLPADCRVQIETIAARPNPA